MSFDALTLAAVRDELEPLVVNSRMQRLAFLDELSVAIECFSPEAGRTYVLCSAHPETGRIQRLQQLPARGLEHDTPWSLIARKHLRNARIRSLRQPRLERVLELDCEQRDASGQHYKVVLIVEAMGRRSNLILVGDDGAILDAARRSPPSRNPRRPVLPHLRYNPPPPQDRLLPEQFTRQLLEDLVRGRGGTLAAFLGQQVAGLSPQAAREVAFRASGSADTALTDADWPKVVEALHILLEERQPTLAVRDEQPIAYAPYLLTHLQPAELKRMPTISAAMDAFYAKAQMVKRGDPLAGERKALQASLEQQTRNAERRVASLQQQLEQSETSREPLRRAGELILTHQPSGTATLEVDGERIELDPTLTASENAQAYFARYRKAREAGERVPQLLEEARQQAEYLANLQALVEVAPDMSAIRALRREAGLDAGRKQPPAKTAPYRRLPLSDGWEALVGASSAGNATVTFDLAKPDDLWLHARGVPGAHVILRGGSSDPPVERAAQLAAWHSSARDATNVEVDVAPRRYVKKIPNAPPGLVRYSNERTVRVMPRG